MSKKIVKLTKQQQEIFRLLNFGKSNKEIAEELSIKVKTVKYHNTQIYKAFGIKSRAELIASRFKKFKGTRKKHWVMPKPKRETVFKFKDILKDRWPNLMKQVNIHPQNDLSLSLYKVISGGFDDLIENK